MNQRHFLDSRYSWLRLAITLTIAIIGNIGIWVIIVILPAIQNEFNVDRGSASLPFTLTMIGFALGNYFIGKAADKFNISSVLFVSAIALCFLFILAAQSNSIIFLSLVQAIIGFWTATCFAPLISNISLWFSKRRGLAVALIASGNYFSGSIWPFLLQDVLNEQGWRSVYWVLAVAIILIMAPLSFALKPKISMEPISQTDKFLQNRPGSIQLSGKNLQLLLGVAGLGCCVAMSMPQVHIVAFCVDLGFGDTVGGQMLSLMLMGGVVSRLISGVLADKIGGVKTLLLGSSLQCMALFLYLPFSDMTSLYIVSLIFGLSQGGIVPSYAVIVREYLPAKEAGARIGFVLMMTVCGMSLGGWMSGWIYDLTGSYTTALWNGILWNFLNIAVVLTLLPKRLSIKKSTH